MNCYNGETYLKEAIQSIVNQTYTNWELIFWDNRSRDNSKKIVKTFKIKKIKYFLSKKKQSLYYARNQALKKCKGMYITFLDTDDWWTKSKLKIQVQLLEKREDFDMTYSNYYLVKNKNKKIFSNTNLPSGNISNDLIKYYCIGILTVMIRSKLFKKYRFSFNNTYNIIGDFDLFMKISKKSKILYYQKPLAYYRIHEKNFSNKNKIFIKELKKWVNLNKKKYLNHQLDRQKQQIKLLELKQYLDEKKFIKSLLLLPRLNLFNLIKIILKKLF